MQSSAAPFAENRVEGRSNVFLTAAMQAGGRSSPVRIRNLSARGALVDAPQLPPIGTRVKLLRGSLSASGQIAWMGDGQAGVNFDGEIDVAAWVQRVGHSGQHRVDGMIAAVRAGTSPVSLTVERDASIAEVSARLDAICQRMAQTERMSVAFAEDLVKLDSVAQALRRLATSRS